MRPLLSAAWPQSKSTSTEPKRREVQPSADLRAPARESPDKCSTGKEEDISPSSQTDSEATVKLLSYEEWEARDKENKEREVADKNGGTGVKSSSSKTKQPVRQYSSRRCVLCFARRTANSSFLIIQNTGGRNRREISG